MKRFWQVVVVVMLGGLFLAVPAWAKWYPGIVHAHSTFSDGDRTPAMLKNAAAAMGCKFLITTDHLEQIGNKKKGLPRADIFTDDFGYANYVREFSVTQPLVCIPAVEITTAQGSHILAIANNDDSVFLMETGLDQQEVINRLNGLKSLPIAAHPSLKSLTTEPLDRGRAEGIVGIEFFNEDSASYKKTLDWYLKLLSQGRNLFVTAGCDSHSPVEATDALRWRRQTMVWADELLAEDIIVAMTNDRTYAANNGAYFQNINYWLGGDFQRVSRPEFQLTIGFMGKTLIFKTLRIYRDGKLVAGSVKTFLPGKKEYSYVWQDKDASAGRHTYVIEVEGCLLTSPINLEVENKRETSRIVVPKKLTPPRQPKVVKPKPELAVPGYLYQDKIDGQIKKDLKKLWQKKDPPHLILLKEDMDYIRQYQTDKRVMEVFVELAKRHIFAARTKTGYSDDSHAISRESDSSWGNISAHYSAQAFDIFYADGVEIAWQVSQDPKKRAKAQAKIREITREMLNLGRKNRYLLPTQMIVYKKEDVDYLASESYAVYGPPGSFGNRGFFWGPRFWDRIHIGY